MTSQTFDFRDGNPVLRLRAGELLMRYPDIDETEERELLDFYNSASALDTALLTCNEALRPNISAFLASHKRDLHHTARLGRLGWLVTVIGVGTMAAIWFGM